MTTQPRAQQPEDQQPQDRQPSDRPLIVIGVSRTSHSPVALRWAADAAERYHADLLAVRAWRPSRPPSSAASRPPVVSRDVDAERVHAEAALNDDVQEVLGSGHRAYCEIREGTTSAVLNALSRVADLLVIDAPRRTDFGNSPTLASRLVYQAACPVVVMPPRVSRSPDSPLVAAGKWLARGILESAAIAGRPGIRPPAQGVQRPGAEG
jgi:hypothetical protein